MRASGSPPGCVVAPPDLALHLAGERDASAWPARAARIPSGRECAVRALGRLDPGVLDGGVQRERVRAVALEARRIGNPLQQRHAARSDRLGEQQQPVAPRLEAALELRRRPGVSIGQPSASSRRQGRGRPAAAASRR